MQGMSAPHFALCLIVLLVPVLSAQDTPVRIACIGDQVLTGRPNADGERHAWPRLLERWLTEETGRETRVGVFRSDAPGSEESAAGDSVQAARAFAPDTVILAMSASVTRSEESLTRLIPDLHRWLESVAPARGASSPRVLLVGLTPVFPPVEPDLATRTRRQRADDVLRQIAREGGASYLSLTTRFAGHGELFPDGRTPNTAAHGIVARAVAEAILDRPLARPHAIGPIMGEGLERAPTWQLIVAGRIASPPVEDEADEIFASVHEPLAPGPTWEEVPDALQGYGKGRRLVAPLLLTGDFRLRARLRLLDQERSAAAFHLGPDVFGFEGAKETIFRSGPSFGGLRLLHRSPLIFERGSWFDFEVVRVEDDVVFRINGLDVARAIIQGIIPDVGFDPMRARMQIASWSIQGQWMPESRASARPTLPLIDLDQDPGRHVLVDREKGQYLGHVTTALLEDGKTILAVYPKGHGSGAIVYKRSTDGGLTWSERLPTPENWATSREVPTIHRLVDPQTGEKALIMWSGLHPARIARSEDDGRSWTPLQPVGDWGGIVVMGCVERLKDGTYLAMFHDDGRFLRAGGRRENPVRFRLLATRSADFGRTWSEPKVVLDDTRLQPCEPGLIRSPDGKTLAVLLRENARRRNSLVIFSRDEGRTWTAPRELPADLTGDRHTARYAPDGRLLICFRDMARDSETKGDWLAWVGTFDDIVKNQPGQYRVRIKDNKNSWDSTYPGVEVLPDGTFVLTTYGHWEAGEEPYILSARLRLDELDARLKR